MAGADLFSSLVIGISSLQVKEWQFIRLRGEITSGGGER